MSELHDISTGNVPTAIVDNALPTIGAVSSTPCGNIDSSTFLQESCFTGYQISVPLPLGAVNGFQPMFAVRVDPLTWTPTIFMDTATRNYLSSITSDVTGSGLNEDKLGAIPIRPYNGATIKVTGPEPPQSIFTRMYRYWRGDIVYNIRIVSSYTGGGILMVVPVKGLPRGTVPLLRGGSNFQTLANGMLVNSNIQCDLSKSRQFRFVYPYEYPTEFRDISQDTVVPWRYNGKNTDFGAAMTDFENWFVVGTRGSIITPTNATTLEFFIDYAFGQYSLHTPLLPNLDAIYPSVSIWSNGNVTWSQSFGELDFPDSVPNGATVPIMNSGNTIKDVWTMAYHDPAVAGEWKVMSIGVSSTIYFKINQNIYVTTQGGAAPTGQHSVDAFSLGLASDSSFEWSKNAVVQTVSSDVENPTQIYPTTDVWKVTN